MAKKLMPVFRKCFVLQEIEVNLGDVKAGDIFRMGKASEDDCVNESEWWIALKKAVPCRPRGNYTVEGQQIAFVPTSHVRVRR
jgi:hypothetical protein